MRGEFSEDVRLRVANLIYRVIQEGKRTTLDSRCLLLSFQRKQESRVVLLANEGQRKNPGFPIKNVGNDKRGTSVRNDRRGRMSGIVNVH